MKLIGLTGVAGSGKDTVAGFALEWCEENGLNAERLAFADPLKVSAARALGFDGNTAQCIKFCNALKQPGTSIAIGGEYAGGGFEVTDEISGRQYLQFYGTEAHRDVFGSEFWVEVTEHKLSELAVTIDLDVVFLTDTRFTNEVAMIRKYDGEIWEVVRPQQSKVEAHVSEAGLPEGAIEFQIHNVSSLDALRVLIHSVCEANLKEAE